MIAETATTTNDATLGVQIIDREDGYHLITEGVAQESAHLSNLREEITKEIWHLEAVYKTMCDHNNYLGSQLDSFAEREIIDFN
ncbi:5900_t:CDS:2 [Rhizophagus irregularis]|nr:5900_t:CDS:2 [Rhizophagus irregularis]